MALAAYDGRGALCWAQQAAGSGSVRAEYLLGMILSSDLPLVPVDWIAASRHLLAAANAGNLDAMRHRIEFYKMAPIKERQHWIDDATSQYNDWVAHYNKICGAKIVEDAMLDLVDKVNGDPEMTTTRAALGTIVGINTKLRNMRVLSATVNDATSKALFTCEGGFQMTVGVDKAGDPIFPDVSQLQQKVDDVQLAVSNLRDMVVNSSEAINRIKKFQIFLMISKKYPTSWYVSMPYQFNHFMKNPMMLRKPETDEVDLQ